MKFVSRMRPSPSMAVASTALFVALGGVSYGVATGSIDSREVKNASLGGGDLKKNTITSREIRSRAIDGTDIKLNRVGYNAVKEEGLDASKFKKVPSAANADTLQGNAASAFQPASKQLRFGVISLNPGDPDATIGTFGPFTLRAECDAGGGDPDFANGQITLTTTENNSDADSDESSDDDLDTGEQFNASAGEDEDDEINAASPSGTAITGALYTSDDDAGLGGGCDFWGEVTTVSGG